MSESSTWKSGTAPVEGVLSVKDTDGCGDNRAEEPKKKKNI